MLKMTWSQNSFNLSVSSIVLLVGIYLIFPIPHTAALRNLLLLLLACVAIYLWWKTRYLNEGASHRYGELLALGILSVWLLLTLLWAADMRFSLDNYLSEWLGSLFVAWIGYALMRGLAKTGDISGPSKLPSWIALALFVHGAWMLAYQFTLWPNGGAFPFGTTPYAEYATLSTSINMTFALLLADIFLRWAKQGQLFPWSPMITAMLFLVTITAVISAKARNGIIVVFALLFLMVFLSIWRERVQLRLKRYLLPGVVIVLLASALLASSIAFDSRWNVFFESATHAVDTQHNIAWLDGSEAHLPTLSDGQQADHSAYMRIAWAKVAVEGIAHRPLGYGYGLGGFGRYIEEVYGGQAVSSHSGILDFTLANGLPGLVLFLAFVVLLFRRGWLSWCAGNPWGLALMLTLSNYFFRIMLDGHFGGFRLKMVALLIGILYWLVTAHHHATQHSQALPTCCRPPAE